MPHPSLIILGSSESAMFLRQPSAPRISAIISIHDSHYDCSAGFQPASPSPGTPGEGRGEGFSDSPIHRLTLRFDDIDNLDPSNPLSLDIAWAHRKWAAETGRPQVPPTLDDARAILDFANQIKDQGGTLLCQCHAGISRSPAAALLCLAAWSNPGQETQCMDYLLRLRPSAIPLLSLIRFGDQLLGRNGQLTAAALAARQR